MRSRRIDGEGGTVGKRCWGGEYGLLHGKKLLLS